MNSPEDAQLSGCSTLLDALLKVHELGLREGSIQLSTDDLHGWVTYYGHKISRAVIAETAQTGNEALDRLMALDGAACRFLTLAEELKDPLMSAWSARSADSENPPQTQSSAGAVDASRSTKHGPIVPATATDDYSEFENTTQVVPNPDGSAAKSSMRRTTEQEREELFENLLEDQRAEFARVEGRLSDGQAQARRDTHFTRKLMDTTEPESAATMLSRAGFVSDFHDSAPQNRDAWSSFHGDPSKLPIANFKVGRKAGTFARYVWPAIVAALCIAIYVVPALIWQMPSASVSKDERTTHMRSLVDGTLEQMDSNAEPTASSAAFTLPPAPPPAAAPSFTGADDEASRAIGKPGSSQRQGTAAGADPSDDAEFHLADSRATLPALEPLIFGYIAKHDFKRAKLLAGAGFRSRFATAEEKQRFWQLYLQCLGKS